MLVFDIGAKILIIITAAFFLVLFFLSAFWAKPAHPRRYKVIGFWVSIFHTFWIFWGGFLVLAVFTLICFTGKYLLSIFNSLSGW